MKFFSLPAFIISLAIGLFIVYVVTPDHEVIHVYPTLDNINDVLYKDKADNCFRFEAKEISCPKDDKKIKNVPIQ